METPGNYKITTISTSKHIDNDDYATGIRIGDSTSTEVRFFSNSQVEYHAPDVPPAGQFPAGPCRWIQPLLPGPLAPPPPPPTPPPGLPDDRPGGGPRGVLPAPTLFAPGPDPQTSEAAPGTPVSDQVLLPAPPSLLMPPGTIPPPLPLPPLPPTPAEEKLLLLVLKLQVDDEMLIESVGDGLLLLANSSESFAEPTEIDAIGLRAMLPGVMSDLNTYLNTIQQLIQQQKRLRSERLVEYLRIQIPSLHGHLDLLDERAQLGIRLYRALACASCSGDTTVASNTATLIERSHIASLAAVSDPSAHRGSSSQVASDSSYTTTSAELRMRFVSTPIAQAAARRVAHAEAAHVRHGAVALQQLDRVVQVHVGRSESELDVLLLVAHLAQDAVLLAAPDDFQRSTADAYTVRGFAVQVGLSTTGAHSADVAPIVTHQVATGGRRIRPNAGAAATEQWFLGRVPRLIDAAPWGSRSGCSIAGPIHPRCASSATEWTTWARLVIPVTATASTAEGRIVPRSVIAPSRTTVATCCPSAPHATVCFERIATRSRAYHARASERTRPTRTTSTEWARVQPTQRSIASIASHHLLCGSPRWSATIASTAGSTGSRPQGRSVVKVRIATYGWRRIIIPAGDGLRQRNIRWATAQGTSTCCTTTSSQRPLVTAIRTSRSNSSSYADCRSRWRHFAHRIVL
uniref:Uncharacterized protein n=1 Tax=Anopheles atroparvus TaxID=41427 RepID=A0A182IYL4_ANOAO